MYVSISELAYLLSNVKLSIREKLNKGGDNISINYSLDLLLIPSSDVGNGPTCLFVMKFQDI